MRPIIGITCCYDEAQRKYTLGEDYILAVQAAGGVPFIIPHINDEQNISEILNAIDGVLLSGGGDLDPFFFGEEPLPQNGFIDPDRDRLEILITKMALEIGMPILGICRGMQVMNVAAGGTIYQDISMALDKHIQHQQQAPRWYPTHNINIVEDSLLHGMLQKKVIRVNSFHHQILSLIGKNFMVSSTANDGVVESIEHIDRKKFVLGVQFHPENIYMKYSLFLHIFTEFVQTSAQFLSSKRQLSKKGKAH